MTKIKPVKIAALIVLSIFSYSTSRAQRNQSKNDSLLNTRAQSVYVELGGPGLIFSGNYDTRFSQRRDGFGGRVGIGFIAGGGSSLISFPVQFNYLLGKGGKYFEIGAGATYASYHGQDIFSFDNNATTTSHTVLGTLTFGYRYQPVDGGFNFRASFNPLFDSSTFYPSAGVSLGYTF
ncbi:MAG: hypothetical protein M3N14_05130 [Bacteroidota bacterium]|nr:hypothetical protein [Bacteroidota bacterium]